jgi:hypothetical protein
MKRLVGLIALFAIVLLVSGLAFAGNACPDSSHNPGGTPPNCGQTTTTPPTTGPECVEDGPVSGTVRENVEPVDPTGGHSPDPNSGGVVHRVNCTVVEGVLGL